MTDIRRDGPDGKKELAPGHKTPPSSAITTAKPAATTQIHELVDAVLNPPEPAAQEGGDAPASNFDHLRTLFEEKDRDEKGMFHALNHLLDLISEDTDMHRAWTEAMRRANNFDSHKVNYGGSTNLSGDDLLLGNLIGDRRNLEAWITNSERNLQQQLTHPGSTFASLGNSHSVGRLLREAKETGDMPMDLSCLARLMRHAICTKTLNRAATAILAEREKRLRERLRLTPHEPILPDHRSAVAYYAYATLEQLKAYLNGDRSDYVFTIDGPDSVGITKAE
ncbi:MAG: hypothetical protein AAB588_06905 [Patescibacteria group bacterium]